MPSPHLPAIAPTDEQLAIFDSYAKTLVVNAYAGCGKTTTLVELAKRKKNQSILYLAFNKSIKEEGAKKFPANVTCKTTHSLAYAKHGYVYQNNKKLGQPKPNQIANALGVDLVTGGFILEVVTHYLNSPYRQLTDKHMSSVLEALLSNREVDLAGRNITGEISNYARRAWEIMKDPANPAIPMPHDGYLKLYQLSGPKLGKFDFILLDEGQDSNPVVLDIIKTQNTRKVVVGDRYQAIYGFKGAINALDQVEHDERLTLSKSFRFGEGIASLASWLLADFFKETVPLRGVGPTESGFKVDRSKPYTYIARTNGNLFEEVVSCLLSDQPFGFVGGIEGYRFNTILDAHKLYDGKRRQIRDPFVASFQSFEHMQEYASALDDKELKSLIAVVNRHKSDIPDLVHDIETGVSKELHGDEIAFSTVHKAKGLEWNNVVLADDFINLSPTKKSTQDKADKAEVVIADPEEIRLLYVAMSRAIANIEPNRSMVDWLQHSNRMDDFTARRWNTEDIVKLQEVTGLAADLSVIIEKLKMGRILSKMERELLVPILERHSL